MKQASYHNNKHHNSTAACGTGAPRNQHLVSTANQVNKNIMTKAAAQRHSFAHTLSGPEISAHKTCSTHVQHTDKQKA